MSLVRPGETEYLDGIEYVATAGITHTDSFQGTIGWVCQSCGALIGSGPIHSKWHNDGSA